MKGLLLPFKIFSHCNWYFIKVTVIPVLYSIISISRTYNSTIGSYKTYRVNFKFST